MLQRGQLVVLESTTYPGTTRDQLVPRLELESDLTVGKEVNVAFSPERVDPGRTDYTLRSTPKVVGGITDACCERAIALYSRVCDDLVRVSSPEAAEMSKLLENIFRSVNIALVNELALLSERMGIDIWEVVDAAATKPYGFMRFDPGPGMGGHCLPVDPFYLAWRAREFDMSTEFIELAGKVNATMPYHCVERIERALNDVSKPVRGSRVAILGASYKGGVGDTRESPALRIMKVLGARGAELRYHDPHVPSLPDFGLQSSPLDEAVADADAVVLVTAHPGIDYGSLARDAAVFVDLRGVTRGQHARPREMRRIRLFARVHPQRQGVVAPRHVAAPERRLTLRNARDRGRRAARAAAGPSARTARAMGRQLLDHLVAQLRHELGLHVCPGAVLTASVEHALQRDVRDWLHHVHHWLGDLADRREHPLALLVIAGPADDHPEHRRALHLRRHERLWRGADECGAESEVVRRIHHVLAQESQRRRPAIGWAGHHPAVARSGRPRGGRR